MTVITDPDQIEADWLTGVLRRAGVLPRGSVTGVATETELTYTATAARLAVRYSDDAPDSAPPRLFLKLGTRRIEVEFFQRVAGAMPDPPVVRCFDAAYDAASGRTHLLFEDTSATHRTPGNALLTPSDHRQVIDSLSIIHAHWWNHPRLRSDLTDCGEDVKRYVHSVAQREFPRFAQGMSPQVCALYSRALAGWPPAHLQARLERRDRVTLVHGDSHQWNCLFPRHPQSGRVLLVDWAVWHIGLGTDDLAYLIGMEPPAVRASSEKALVRFYHERLVAHGVVGYDWDQCWLDYRTSAIFNLFWPVFHWALDLPSEIWRTSLDGALAAFDDLGCIELLD